MSKIKMAESFNQLHVGVALATNLGVALVAY